MCTWEKCHAGVFMYYTETLTQEYVAQGVLV